MEQSGHVIQCFSSNCNIGNAALTFTELLEWVIQHSTALCQALTTRGPFASKYASVRVPLLYRPVPVLYRSIPVLHRSVPTLRTSRKHTPHLVTSLRLRASLKVAHSSPPPLPPLSTPPLNWTPTASRRRLTMPTRRRRPRPPRWRERRRVARRQGRPTRRGATPTRRRTTGPQEPRNELGDLGQMDTGCEICPLRR